jgi:ketosteroid isomerase-like protein
MPACTPEELHGLFSRLFAAGDLDALVALYEPQAVLYPQPGVAACGTAAIRDALAAFLALRGTFSMSTGRLICADGVALAFAPWTLVATGPDGKPVIMAGSATDVLRRQADGTWRFAIDNPFGAECVDS